MPPRQIRYRLLLDEMLPRREQFPQLNNYHDVRHIVHDLKKPGILDPKVVEIAKQQNRIVVTKNVRHFLTLFRRSLVDMVGLSGLISYEKIDAKVMAYLRRRSVVKMTGAYTKITE